MPPQPPPPAMKDDPEIAEPELDMAPETDQPKRQYRRVVASAGVSKGSSKYKGGGLNVV